MIEGKSRDPNETRTPGIAQHEKIEIQGWSPDDCQVRLNAWDFGGQEMMRGTHRFFLTERSLYLLVLEDRRLDDRSIYDWMKTICNRGGDSPVIVVINKSDSGKQDLRLDEVGLREAYPSIVAFLRTSCDPGEWAGNSIKALRRTVVEIIASNPRLKHVHDPIPANWLHIKDRLRTLTSEHSVLPHTDFVSLCKDTNGGEAVTDDNEQRALLRLLHDLGAIVAHGLGRDASAASREINLLDPNWLTGAVYRILEKASSVDQEGEFLRRDLAEWLDLHTYPAKWHEFILERMQEREIGLCFRLPPPVEDGYLIPEALPPNRRFYEWPEDCLRFRYGYNFLPSGLIPRFIVESHRHLTADKRRWRTGAVLRVRDCDILVLADLDQQRVDIQIAGSPALRRAALNVVLDDLDAVHALNPEADPVAVVPLPDHPDTGVSYDYLLTLEREEGSDFLFRPEGTIHLPAGATRRYTVGELLDGVRRDGRHQPRRTDSPPQPAKLHVVILVHGIRTRALWQNDLRNVLQNEGFVVEPINYGYFDLVRFLIPSQPFAGTIVDDVAQQIRDILSIHKGADCSIIAHSFGTFVVARILRDHTELEFNKIIFCGSVVSHQFRFASYRSRFKPPLINEVGTRDFWPAAAEAVTFGYGSAGTYGFRRAAVLDRWHNGKAHSDFLNKEFCKTHWVPVLHDRPIEPDDKEAEPPPWGLWILSTFQIRYVILAIVAGALLWRWLAA
jgi:pimeloyl-ACP methyl ester carboxylesterase